MTELEYLEYHRKHNARYREQHREELNAKRREYYKRNRETEIDRAKRYYYQQKAERIRTVTQNEMQG